MLKGEIQLGVGGEEGHIQGLSIGKVDVCKKSTTLTGLAAKGTWGGVRGWIVGSLGRGKILKVRL